MVAFFTVNGIWLDYYSPLLGGAGAGLPGSPPPGAAAGAGLTGPISISFWSGLRAKWYLSDQSACFFLRHRMKRHSRMKLNTVNPIINSKDDGCTLLPSLLLSRFMVKKWVPSAVWIPVPGSALSMASVEALAPMIREFRMRMDFSFGDDDKFDRFTLFQDHWIYWNTVEVYVRYDMTMLSSTGSLFFTVTEYFESQLKFYVE